MILATLATAMLTACAAMAQVEPDPQEAKVYVKMDF